MEPVFIPHDPPRTYGKAAVYGDLIFLAGEDGKDPVTLRLRGSTVAEQAEQLFANLARTLGELGSSLEHVVKITAYLTDPASRPAFQAARSRHLPQQPPGTLVMGVQLADPEMLIEIDAIAVRAGSPRGSGG